ncbi:uncharacterized protein LOC122092925 [Macadamia integrifolia]|uniref:uncharacterized protein LOC122092925 n=1 Tax=Macadamia integrifolia TaxID=60698 RepID=UPI001C52CCD3|nr:uncharacterized protein LOC122092925 [Macadamia integrifolia]
MGRQKEKFWQHAEQLDSLHFKCKFCEKQVYGGVTRLKYHLAKVSGHDVASCEKVSDDVQAKALLAINYESSSKKQKSCTSGESIVGSSPLAITSQRQSTMEEMIPKMDKSTWEKSLCDLFIKNNISFNVVQSDAFINFVKCTARYGPSVPIPSYGTLRGRIIPEARKDLGKYVEEVKFSWKQTGCTFMSDSWTDLKKQSFLNVIAYSPGGALFLKSEECSHAKLTAFYIFDILEKEIESIGPNLVVQLISDNASNYSSALDMLTGKYRWLFKTRCAAHGINLMLKDIYENVFWVQEIFDEAKRIIDYLYKSIIVLQLMRSFTKKDLKYPCKTRFASNFLMLQSIVEVEEKLRLLVALAEWRSLRNSRSLEAERVVDTIQRESFWNDSKEILRFMEPIIRVLRLVDGDGATSEYLYEAMERAREVLEKHYEENHRYDQILKIFNKRRDENILGIIHYAAAVFNPTYFFSERFKKIPQMKDAIDFIGETVVPQDERREYYGQLAVYHMKSSTLFTPSAKMMMETSHPRVWWHIQGDAIPILQKYAIRILSQPCSSSACERNWSAWDAAQTKRRNRLSATMLDDLVYVRMNSLMMEKRGELEQKNMLPINLDNISVNDFDQRIEDVDKELERLLDDVDDSIAEDLIFGASASFTESETQPPDII